MIEIYHLQKRHPDAEEFRIWSLLANDTIAVRTVGRVMALNKQVYDDIPHVSAKQAKQPPGPHPYKATSAHQYWFIDGRMMDFALDGVKWWSILILDGYSRTLLAGAMAPSEASWAALTVLYTAQPSPKLPYTVCLTSGVSDPIECSRILGALSPQTTHASGPIAVSRRAIVALRTRTYGVEELRCGIQPRNSPTILVPSSYSSATIT
jgi:hypothetical protein